MDRSTLVAAQLGTTARTARLPEPDGLALSPG